MNRQINKERILEDVNFSVIKETRFKTGRISFNMLLPLKNDTVSANAVLPYVLHRSCREYPDFRKLNQKLEELYGAALYADVKKLGEVQILTLGAAFIDDRYVLNSENISTELAKLLCSIIFEPNFENNRFKKEEVEQERRQLIENIEAEYSDKRLYAKRRCEQLMCADERFGISRLGTVEQAKAITGEDIYKAWEYALKSAKIEIILLGNTNEQKVYDIFKQAFSKVKRDKKADCSTQVIEKALKVKEYTDSEDVNQAKLVMGFRSGLLGDDSDIISRTVMTALLGGTAHSKLFLNVREKLSLCYYCSSSFDRNKSIMLIQSGVEQKNITAAKKEILNQIEAVKTGDFDKDEIDATKLSVSNSFMSICDSPSLLESFYISQLLSDHMDSPYDRVKKVLSVTRDQIIKAARDISLDTVYTLVSKE